MVRPSGDVREEMVVGAVVKFGGCLQRDIGWMPGDSHDGSSDQW